MTTIITKEFSLDSLFTIKISKSVDKLLLDLTSSGKFDYIGRTALNNGIQGKLDYLPFSPNDENTYSLSQIGDKICQFRENKWYACQNMFLLTPVYTDSHKAHKYLTTVINAALRSAYSGSAYTSYPTLNDLPKLAIQLPVTQSGYPDWDYMEQYIENLEKTLHDALNCFITFTNTESKVVDTGNWREFNIGDLFEIINGKGITKDELYKHPGEIIAIQSGEDDNGCIGMIDEKYCKAMNYHIEYKPALTVARSGSSGFITFQDKPFVVGDSAKILKPKFRMNKAQLLFLRVVLMELKKKFSYKDKVSTERYKAETIKLPVTNTGKIDFDYMEKYISSLETVIADKLDKLEYAISETHSTIETDKKL